MCSCIAFSLCRACLRRGRTIQLGDYFRARRAQYRLPAMSGRISSIAGAREPSGKITVFVGAASGGVWKSDDNGTRYRPVFDEQPVQSIGAIALDPKNSKNVWVGTGESWTRNSVSIGDGIYKSTDRGETWSHAG